jgi:hypothetical protein
LDGKTLRIHQKVPDRTGRHQQRCFTKRNNATISLFLREVEHTVTFSFIVFLRPFLLYYEDADKSKNVRIFILIMCGHYWGKKHIKTFHVILNMFVLEIFYGNTGSKGRTTRSAVITYGTLYRSMSS